MPYAASAWPMRLLHGFPTRGTVGYFRRMKRGTHCALAVLALAAPACSAGVFGDDASAPDRPPLDAAPADHATPLDVAAPLDQAAPIDAAPAIDAFPTPSDSAAPKDFSAAADLTVPTDFASAPDLAAPMDFASAPDLAAEKDFASAPDLAPAADLSMCAPVAPAADVDPWRIRVAGPPLNKILHQNGADYLAGPNDYIRLGASLAWGGSVTFFGLTANPQSNVIDANDPGRELQLALYDPARAHQPCAATATCVSNPMSCANSISYLGWDPVQGGDRCGNGAAVLSHGQSGDALRVVVQPLQWNPDWDQPNCNQGCGKAPAQVTYSLDYRFVDQNVVEIAVEVSSQEMIDHAPTGQEFPTLYVAHGGNAPDLPLLLDAAGHQIAINTPANDGFFVADFASPENWVTFQNQNQDYGVALAMDQGITGFQGWRGDGQKSPYFHNVRAHIGFGLPAGGVVRGIAYLALGNFPTVKALMEATRKRRPPFGVVDVPAAGAPLSYPAGQPVTFSGWVLDSAKLASVRVEIDGQLAATLPVGAARPDVCAVYPAYDGCPGVGFSGAVPTAGLSPCAHLARVLATDGDGNTTVLGERAIAPR